MRVFFIDKPAGSGGANWLITLADLIALLVCFFVMMFAMSSLDTGRWDAVSRGLRDAMPARDHTRLPRPDAQSVARPLPVAEGLDLSYLAVLLTRRLAADPVLARASVVSSDETLVVALPGDLLFAERDVILREEGLRAVRRLAEHLAYIRNELAVVGRSGLSAERGGWMAGIEAAAVVAQALREAGVRADIRTLGMAAAAGRDATDGRVTSRIEIVLRENGIR